MLAKEHSSGVCRVVITGLGVASSLGCSVREFWARLLEGESGVRTITDIDLSQCRTRIGARVANYDATQHFSSKELQRLSLSSQFALIAATEAIEDACLELGYYDPEKVGVFIGSSNGGFAASEPFFRSAFETGRVSPLAIPVIMNSSPASNISIRFGFKGSMMAIDAACASSSHAIGYAYNLIRMGLLELAVTGGADSAISPAIMQAWSSLRALSERNEMPEEACRPFSKDRDGLVLGEGAGVLVLESEDSAVRRKARIHGEIVGYAASSDSHHITQPSAEGIGRAMNLALDDASLVPAEIDYICAHATATRWNDRVETEAIKTVFGSSAYKIPVVGIKAAIGHTIAASGALGLISCMLSIRDGLVPPTINFRIRDPDCDLDYVIDGKRRCDITHAMCNSFGFGGSNAVLVTGRYSS